MKFVSCCNAQLFGPLLTDYPHCRIVFATAGVAIAVASISIGSAQTPTLSVKNHLGFDLYWQPDGLQESILNYGRRIGLDEEFHLAVGEGNLKVEQGKAHAAFFNVGYMGGYVGGDFSFWGNNDVLTTQEVTVTGRFTRDDWSLEIIPGFRRIYLYGSDPLTDNESGQRGRRDIDDFSMASRIVFFSGDQWSHRIHGLYHHYSDDLKNLNVERLLASIERLRQSGQTLTDTQRRRIGAVMAVFQRFSDPLSMVTMFERWRAAYRLGYTFSRWQVGADLSVSESAVTEEVNDYIAMDADYEAGSWLLRLGYSVEIGNASDWMITSGFQYDY